MKFAINFRNLMIEKGLTQQYIASKMSTTQQTISRWLNGQNEPDLTNLYKLAEILDCTIDYLLGREDDFGIVKSGAELQLKEDEAKLLSEYRLLDEINKIKAQTFIYALAH